MWRNSEYYWDMLFECIYILVSAMHSEDHQEFSMPKVIWKTFRRTALCLGYDYKNGETTQQPPSFLSGFFHGNLDKGPEAQVPLQQSAMKNH